MIDLHLAKSAKPNSIVSRHFSAMQIQVDTNIIGSFNRVDVIS